MKILPSVTSSSPPIIRNVVVLPHPDGPSMATNSPCSIPALKSITARAPPGKVFETCSRTTSKLLIRPDTLAGCFGNRIDHVPYRVERHVIERALLVELGENLDRLA